MTKILALFTAGGLAVLSLLAPIALQTGNAASTPGMLSASQPEESVDVFVYHDDGLRDPFVPLIMPTPIPPMEILPVLDEPTPEPVEEAVAAAPTPTPTPVMLPANVELECVLYSQDQRVAVIDGVFLMEGDSLDDMITIDAIHESHVDVVYEGESFELHIPSPLEQLDRAAQVRRRISGTTTASSRGGARRR